MGFTNLKQPHSATRKDQDGRRVALDTWYLQFQHDAKLRDLKSQCTWLYPVPANFLSRTPWSVKSRTRTAEGKALIRENERWREKADPQSGMKVRCPFPCSQRLIEPATSPQNPIKTHHIICHHTVSYHHMVYYTKSSIKGKREKHWKTRVINDFTSFQ